MADRPTWLVQGTVLADGGATVTIYVRVLAPTRRAAVAAVLERRPDFVFVSAGLYVTEVLVADSVQEAT